MRLHVLSLSFLVFSCVLLGDASLASELWIGTSTVSITPDKSVALAGLHHTRIARKVASPCTATAVALESRQGDKTLDFAILVSCDLIAIRGGVKERLHEKVAKRLPGFDVNKIVVNGTHTHTAPALEKGAYDIPPDAMQPSDYVEFLTDRLCELVAEAWESRQPGGVSWGLGHAVVTYNRRMVDADGSAVMYGKTDVDTFRRVEGREDHGVEVLFFWDKNKKLLAMAVNVACPSQEVESTREVNADFWHEVRLGLREKYGDHVQVLGWSGAAGDQSPHIRWRKQAEERMRKGRGLTRLEEIARRILRAVDEAHEVAKKDIRFKNVPLSHVVKEIELPPRKVTAEQYAERKAKYEKLSKEKGGDSKGEAAKRVAMAHLKDVLDRYEAQKDTDRYRMTLHVIRLGDVAIATNPFELYTDFGIQIKARSKAVQTFVIQLVGSGRYLPTEEAIRGGGYSTDVRSNNVGPEGGQVLVDRTIEEINRLWKGKK